MFAYKCQVFITMGTRLLSFYRVFHNSTEINDKLNLINEDIFNYIQDNFYKVSNAYFASKECTPLLIEKIYLYLRISPFLGVFEPISSG